MDPLSALFEKPRASDAFMLRVVMDPPWALRIADQAALAVVIVISGHVWVTPAQDEPILLSSGDTGLIKGPEPYLFGDRPHPEPQIIIHPGQRCEDLDGNPLDEPLSHGVRTWGNSPTGSTIVIVGIYDSISEAGRRTVNCLPSVARVNGCDIELPVVELISAELTKDMPGQSMVLDRLLDLLAVTALRGWFRAGDHEPPTWWGAADDPIVGPAIRLLHHNLAHAWSVGELAAEVGASRATLARRFTEQVGQSPMAFLTEARLTAAADRLLEPGATVSAVAAGIGYTNPFAFSTAFKRHHGISPNQYRRGAGRSAG